MNLRGFVYQQYAKVRGHRFPRYLTSYVDQDRRGIQPGIARLGLAKLLQHCATYVPYYRDLMRSRGIDERSRLNEPDRVVRELPALTKDIIRARFDQLTSLDIERRKWWYNSSGGSTGEPIKLIQDQEYRDQAAAISLLFSHFVGRDVGQSQLTLWGSDRDLLQGTMGWKANLFNSLSHTRYLNAFRMTPGRMREYLQVISEERPRLLVAYAQSLYELARFAEEEGIRVSPQNAAITSAGTLHPFMRERIERVFGCPVFNRYGSREVGDVACERPGISGLWVAPWATYVEVVDEEGVSVPPGVEGNLLITSLTNYAMPLIRYQIGDRGSLANATLDGPFQVLASVAGRISDNFRTRAGRIVPGEYFIHMIGVVLDQGNIRRFQLIQKDYEHLHFRVALRNSGAFDPTEILEKIRLAMDPNCRIDVEVVDDIAPTPSGKYCYTRCDIV